MATSPKPVAQKAAAPKAVAAPKPEAKAPTKAEAAAAAKAEKEAAAAKAAADKQAAADKAAKKAEQHRAREAAAKESAAARKERAEKEAANVAKVGQMRNEGAKWPEVAEALGISTSKAQVLGKVFEAQSAGPVKKGTPALVIHDRDVLHMGWDDIAVQYGLKKSGAQKLYREGGKDPNKSYVGKGGRYFSHEGDIASQRAEFAKEAKPAKEKGAPKEKAPAKPLFTDESTAEEIKAKLNGKTITTLAGHEYPVKADSIKAVGTEKKSGLRVVQFTNAKTGGTTTVKVLEIIKAAK